MTDTPLLQFNRLEIGYRHKIITTETMCGQLHRGYLTCLIGRNGAGKSTLLRTLAKLHRPIAGEIKLLGKTITTYSPRELAKKMAVVLTDRITDDNITARQVVETGRYAYTNWTGRLSEEDQQIVEQALDRTGSSSLTHRLMHTLSDGEQQKIMMAKALAQQTPIILLDEPTAFLDYTATPAWLYLLHQLAHDEGKAILFSCHDIEAALRVSDETWVMHQGKLLKGSPEQLGHDGTIGKCFNSEYVHFDTENLHFHISRTPHAQKTEQGKR